MIKVKGDGFGAAVQWLGRVGGEMQTVRRNVMNDLAFMVRKEEMATAAKVFDRPKPQTVKNFFVRKATKERPEALIWFDQQYNKGYEEYMEAQVKGGRRVKKPSEKRLGQFYVPGVGAKLDRYGNMQGGQITQVLSRLGRFGDVAGYDMNRTVRSMKRSGTKGTEYFVVSRPMNGLKPGVYMRTEKRGGFTSTAAPRSRRGQVGAFQSGRGGAVRARGVVPVMVFTRSAPAYRPRFPFYEVAQEVVDKNWQAVVTRELGYAARRAGR